ncbi:class I SAM-dependent methyltransferase [Occallatibacter riparius]|uniref:Class I SAM-dependent methyltransferase n=1 Tax=Occallatibacter riparius TaxID=1002689 RepID=A0A9J7BTN9_9BACT|nr:class I SAM-dependent methyltransferase [Occallatibacter riparius]UWZ85999.1 class I SAM-dependent methyltransferase [Occallatibacter riparius]
MSSRPTGTFRDPQGTLYQDGDRIFREIYPRYSAQVLAWLGSEPASRWMREGRMVPTEIVASEPVTLLEHERIEFPSYPWEWAAGQWIAAGLLTLDLCEEALGSGYILKDATPFNVLFSSAKPVFIDVLSFEKRDPNNPLWIAQAQFVRTFLLPLAAYRYLGWPLSASQQRRDGYEPADLAHRLGFAQKWSSPLRSLVALPLLFERSFSEKAAKSHNSIRKVSEDLAELILRRTIRKMRKNLRALTPPVHASRWSGYTETASHYDSGDHAAKQNFVRTSIKSTGALHVLDVGANTGVYSRIAAECGAAVVAWDPDVSATELHYQAASRDELPVLPLVADFARPSPAIGWRNAEYASLLARAKGRFDCVLMLGVLHHLLVAEQIPLAEIIEQLAEITTRWAVLEWVPQEDSQFSGLVRGREELYAHLTESYFTQVLGERFATRSRERLPNGRTLLLVEKVS